jgi:protein SCO1
MIKKIVLKNWRLAVFLLLACNASSCIREKPLPIYGEKELSGRDTIYHTISNFRFLNQDSSFVTNETVKGKVYVADFFFTSCRTICPIMKSQMLRVYEQFKNNPDVMILSHTIDPEYDTVGLLRDYAQRLGVSSNTWHFLTGSKDDIFTIAERSYFITAMEDESEPDGFIHSGAFLLIDRKQRIRGKYDGTKSHDVDRLIKDITRLKKEQD